MADREGENSRTPSHVMALCTYASSTASFLLSSIGIVLVPWGLHLIYGKAYDSAATTVAVALAVAVVHMGSAPAGARLSIVSIRSTGVINTVWAIFVAAAGTAFLLHGGSAGRAMTIYLAAHILSSVLQLGVLAWKDHIPSGVIPVFSFSCFTAIALAVLSVFRGRNPEHAFSVTAIMAMMAVGAWVVLFSVGRKNRWLPDSAAVRAMVQTALGRARQMLPFGRTKDRR
jgi:hypothetical protein